MGSLLLAAWLLKPSQFFSSAASEDGGRGSSPWDPFGRTGGKHAEFKKAGILHPGSLLRPSLWMASWQTRVCQRGNEDGMEKKKGTHTDSCQALVSLSLLFPKAEEEGLVEGGTEEETESRRHHAPPTPPPPKKLKTFCLHTLCVSKEPLAYGIARINYRPTWRDLFCILSDALSRRSD